MGWGVRKEKTTPLSVIEEKLMVNPSFVPKRSVCVFNVLETN